MFEDRTAALTIAPTAFCAGAAVHARCCRCLRVCLGNQRFVREGDWYAGVDMGGGFVTSRKFENLMAFWPGLQTLIGATGRVRR